MANDAFGSLIGISNALTGTPKSTTTATSGIDSSTLSAALKQILDSSSGLASISQGSRTSGVAGSSQKTLLVNDLLTRAAAQVQSQNRSQTQTTQTAGNPLGILSSLGTIYGLSKLFGPDSEEDKKKKLGTSAGASQLTSTFIDSLASAASGPSGGIDFLSNLAGVSGGAADAIGTAAALSELGSSAASTDLFAELAAALFL